MRLLPLLFSAIISFGVFGQSVDFQSIYNSNPFIPKGLLEAVAWNNTRMAHLIDPVQSCSGMPKAYGIMGLIENGENYFKENGVYISDLSGISVQNQKNSPAAQVNAYASAYTALINNLNLDPNDPQTIREVLHALSEIPDTGYVNFLAKEIQVFQVLRFLNSPEQAQQFNFPTYHFDLENIFGEDNFKVLNSPRIRFTPSGIQSSNGEVFAISANKSLQYGPAIWNPAPSCNFSSRQGTPVSAITIHTIQGTYAGAISWSQNCASNVSYHYVIRSVDGQVTQMVLEEDKAWHVGSENPYTIGYEHEGYVDNPAWYTEAMYYSSADLSRDIINSGYGIDPLRTYYGDPSVGLNTLGGCTRVKGHQHYPNQSHTDPGINWNWEKYYKLINNSFAPTIITSSSSSLTDTGGSTGDYTDDERNFWLIQPQNASSIQLTFTAFELETDYDYLFIYDGDSVDAPLLGVYTGTNNPGTVNSTGGSLLLEFRSDCATTAPGWIANYTPTLSDVNPPLTTILTPNQWKTDDFHIQFADSDSESSIEGQYFLTAKNLLSPDDWFGVDSSVYENFNVSASRWNTITGNYQWDNQTLMIDDVNEQNSNCFVSALQNSNHTYLYQWQQEFISTSSNQRAGLHFFCDDASLTNRGNSYFVYLRENDDQVHIYRVENDVFTLVETAPFIISPFVNYDVKVSFNPVSGWIKVYIDDTYVMSWQDPAPHTSGNAISLRTGGCSVRFDDVFMFRSRSTNVLVTVGPADEINVQSTNAQPTLKVLACSMDGSMNWSNIAEQDYLIDFTSPTMTWLNDGISSSSDIDTFYNASFTANWQASDPHSGVMTYLYAIGILPQLNNIVDWTDIGLNENITEIIQNPVYGQTYYLSIKPENGAGLSDVFLADGQMYLEGLGLSENPLRSVYCYPNPAGNELFISGLSDEIQYELYDPSGKLVRNGSTMGEIDLSILSSGVYHLRLIHQNSFVIEKIIKQ